MFRRTSGSTELRMPGAGQFLGRGDSRPAPNLQPLAFFCPKAKAQTPVLTVKPL